MTKFLLLILSVIALNFAQAQTIVGTVIEESTGEGAIQATVSIKGTTTGTATDFDGNYSLRVNSREGILLIRYVGFKEIEINYSFPEGVNEIRHDAVLVESGTMLDETVVTASRFERKLGEETVSIDVIKPKFIGDQNLTNASEVLGKSPGVTMVDGQANIRGGSGYSFGAGSRVLLLQDGLPIYQADAGRPLWSSIPLENIGQIEIIKGAASALYGSSAMNGIINVQTAFAKSTPETYVSVFSSFYDTPRAELDSNGVKIDKKWWKQDTLLFSGLEDTVALALNEPHPYNVGVSFSHRRKIGEAEKLDFILGGQYFKEQRWRFGEPNNGGRLNGNIRYRITDKMTFGSGFTARYTQSGNFFLWRGLGENKYLPNSLTGVPTLSKVLNLEFNPYFSIFDDKGNSHKVLTRYLKVNNKNTNNQSNNSDFMYVEYQYQKQFSDIGLSFSAGLVGTYLNSRAPLFGGKTLHGSNLAIYTQADKKFFNKLNVSLGLRVETNFLTDTKTETKPVARFGMNYQAAEATFIRASIGQGYRFPSIAEKFITTQLGSDIAILPNPDLVSETGMTIEVALKQGWKTSNSAFKGFFDVSFFYMRFKNMMEFNVFRDTAFLVAFQSSNVGSTFISGIETNVFAQGKLKSFPTSLVVGYTYIDPKFQIFDLTTKNGGVADYNVLKYRYRHTFTATWDIDFKGFTFGTTWQYYSFMENLDKVFNDESNVLGINFAAFRETRRKDGREADKEARTYRGDFILNLRVGYHTPDGKFKVSFLVNNLANREYSLRPALIEPPRTYSARIDLAF
jgi:outer membrane receptor protein involved in Fe transport